MDKKVIKALSNFGDAIDTLVEELKKQSEKKTEKSSIFSNLFGKNSLNAQIKKIQEGITDIKKDTVEIIKNQKDLLKLSKQKDEGKEGGLFEQTGDKGNIQKIKDGAGSIILIAAGIMAIGLALKLVSPVDVMSALAMAFVITAIGFAMAELVKAGIPNPTESFNLGLSMTIFSAAIALSSLAIWAMPDIKASQFITFLGISVTFGLMFKLGMGKMLESVGKVNLKSIILLPVVLIGISLAIMASSWILKNTEMIEPSKLFNIVLMGFTLGAMALAMVIPVYIIGKMGSAAITGALISIIVLPAISLAIMLSSLILKHGDYSDPIPIDWVLSFSISMLMLTLPVAILGLIPLPLILSGALSLVIISGALVVASYLLSLISPAVMENIADGISYFVDVVGGALIRFGQKALPMLVTIAKAFVTSILPPLKAFIVGILPPITMLLSTIIDSVMPAVLSIIDVGKLIVSEISNIISSIAGVLDSIGGIIEKIGGVFEIIGDKIMGILSGVGDLISTVADSLVKVFDGVTSSIVSLSQIDGGNLMKVGLGLGAIGTGLLAMTAGSIVSKLGSLFTGVDLAGQLEDLSQFHEGIYKTGKGIEMLSAGMSTLKDVDVSSDQLDHIVGVLERINNIGSSANIETVSRQVVDGSDMINELKGLNKPDNEEMLAEMRLMNAQLSQLLSTNSGISSQINGLGDDSEPTLKL